MERNFEGMAYFDHNAYIALAETLKRSDSSDAKDDLSALNDAMTSFREYVNRVDAGEQQIRLAAVRFEGQEYRDMISQYDRRRHDQHENAIINVRLVNRLAELYGTPKLFTGNDQERLEIADFCLDVMIQLFQNRMM